MAADFYLPPAKSRTLLLLKRTSKISIITSCFNQENTIEATIRSIVNQDYPNLEYIFIDAASADRTLEIAEKYGDHIGILLSEPDEGQYFGIQKGLSMATGEIMAWLNGDDVYLPWTLSVVNEIFQQFPEVEWIIGQPSYLNPRNQLTRVSGNAWPVYPRAFIRNGWCRDHLAGYLQQESMFWRKSLWDKAGGLNLNFDYAADFELWTRFACHALLVPVSVPLAGFRKSPEQKSTKDRAIYEREVKEICRAFRHPPWIWDTVASKGLVLRSLFRCLIWKQGAVISFSDSLNKWVKVKAIRPVSRANISGLLAEFSLRRKGKTW